MASYTLTIYDIPQIINKKYISISYNSNGEKSTCTIHTENRTWICTLQDLSYSKAIYKPGELIFKLQITGCSGVNAIYSTFKGKKIELTAQADNKSSSIAKEYYIFGIQIEKKGNVYYATFQAYDPFKFLTLDTYCKAYTGKKFTQDIFLNKDLWPNNLPETIDEQLTIENAQSLKKEREAEKANLEEKQKEINKEINDLNDKINKETNENTKEKLQKTLNEKEALSQNISIRIQELDSEIKKLNSIINDGTKSQFNKNPRYLYYNDKEFIQPYLVQYNESFLDFLVRVSNRCGEFLYYEDGYFNIGWKKKTKKDKDDKEQDDITPITEYVSVNFSDETATAWKQNYIVSSHHNYPLTNKDNRIKRYPTLLPLDEEKLQTEYGKGYNVEEKGGGKIDITGTDQSGTPITIKDKSRSDYEVNVADLQCQDSHLASDENLVSLPPKDQYTKWEDFALFPGYYFINLFTEFVNSSNLAEGITNLIYSTGATSVSSIFSAKSANDSYNKQNFQEGTYIKERENGKCIHPFSTSESVKNALDSYVTFSLEFYEAVRKGIEANERSRIQIALGDHFYPLALGSLIELDGEKYIVVQMNGCANSGAETLDIEAIPYKENEFVFPPSAPVGPIREAKAQRAFITHNTDPLKMNRVRVRYPWQGQTEDPTPWIRIALPMASDGSGFNFLPQIGDEAIINYENGNIEKPYVEGMLYTRAAEEDESTVPYAFKRDKARVISSVNGHSIIFSDPPATTDVFNGVIPLWKTFNSFCPTKYKWNLSDYNKKAMGGIEFTDEHGLYSISMSSDKRAISIDSPLGKVDINAFTGITISAPNGNVRIEGKNIDIVAGNNLSISSGNNINTDFWPRLTSWRQLIKEVGLDLLTDAVVKKLQPIDMGLIRTFMETLLRPIGGTMLIKSNRYLCIEAGKGEAKIPGRNLQLHGTALWNGGFKHKETASYFGDIVSAHQYINELFNTCKANAEAIASLKLQYESVQPNVPNSLAFNQLLTNIINNTTYTSVEDERNKDTKDRAKRLNKTAKRLYKLVDKALWVNVKKSLQKSLSDNCKTVVNAKDAEIKNLCQTAYFMDANNTYRNYNAATAINRVKLRELIVQQVISGLNTTDYGITFNVAPGVVLAYDDASWNTALQNPNNFTLGDVVLDVPSTTGLKRSLVKAWGLNGLFDQYNWDHASGGDILFSRKEGQTLFLDNKTINEYSTTNKILDFLKNI